MMMRSLQRASVGSFGQARELLSPSQRAFESAAVTITNPRDGTLEPYGQTRNATPLRWLATTCAAIVAISAATSRSCSAADAPPATSSDPYVLYQYDVCPWCNKVKAVLDYKGIPYQAVEVHPLFKSEISWSKDYKKVPILVLPNGEHITDSSHIMDAIYAMPARNTSNAITSKSRSRWFGGGDKSTKPSAAALEDEARWRTWADERLVKVLTVNLYSSVHSSYQAMEYIMSAASFSYFSQLVGYSAGGAVMYLVGRRLPAKYGLEGKDLNVELLQAIDEFVTGVGDKAFLGGAQPNRADLAVFGMLRAVSTTDTFGGIINNSRIMPWWARMVEVVGESSRIEELESN